MPYIKPERRPQLDAFIEAIEPALETMEDGDLNYLISSMLWIRFQRNKGYRMINAIVGVLECVKLEFYARMARPYEEEKIVENGDII